MENPCQVYNRLLFVLIILVSIGCIVSIGSARLNHHLFQLLQTIHEPIRNTPASVVQQLRPVSSVNQTLTFSDVYDSRAVLQDRILGVQDQGGCGSCTVFTILSLMADQIAIKSQNPAFPLSAQFVIDCLSKNPAYAQDEYMTVVLAAEYNHTQKNKDKTPPPLIPDKKIIGENVSSQELCSGNFENILAYYLRPELNLGTVSETCLPYVYILPMDFYKPFSKRIRFFLRYQNLVIALVSMILALTILLHLWSERRPIDPRWVVIYVVLVFGGILAPAIAYIVECFRVSDTLRDLKTQYLHSTDRINKIFKRIGNVGYGVSANPPPDLSKPWQCSLTKCVQEQQDSPNRYFLRNFWYLSGIPRVFTSVDVLSQNHQGFRWPETEESKSYASLPLDMKILVLKNAIKQYGSIGMAFLLTPSFYMFFKNEDYRPPYSVDFDTTTGDLIIMGGHNLSIVGYTQTAWILRNQWGNQWGRYDDPGYIYWAFGARNIETENDFYVVSV